MKTITVKKSRGPIVYNGLIGFGEHAQLFIGMIECVDSKERFNKAFMPFLLLAIALLAIVLNRKNPIRIVIRVCREVRELHE